MNEEEKLEQKKRLIKIGIYLGIFILAFILLKIESISSNKNSNNNQNQSQISETPKIIDNIMNLSEDNLEEFVYYTMDDDAITLNFERSGNIEVGEKRYHGENITYIKKENNYYKINEETKTLESLVNFSEFNYDKTFIELSNIKKLLEKGMNPKYEDSKITYEYNIKDIISIYNNYNNTSIIAYDNDTITLEIYYTDETLEYLLINTTNLYNKINEKELYQVLYKIEIKSIDSEDVSWFENLFK